MKLRFFCGFVFLEIRISCRALGRSRLFSQEGPYMFLVSEAVFNQQKRTSLTFLRKLRFFQWRM